MINIINNILLDTQVNPLNSTPQSQNEKANDSQLKASLIEMGYEKIKLIYYLKI